MKWVINIRAARCRVTQNSLGLNWVMGLWETEGGSAPLPCQYRPGRLEQYLEIEPQGPVVDVLKIQIHPFFETDIVPTGGYLPKAGKPGFHGKTPSLPVVIVTHLGRKGRPWADDTHFTLKNVDQLRQLVNAGLPEEGSDIGNDAGIFFDFKNRIL